MIFDNFFDLPFELLRHIFCFVSREYYYFSLNRVCRAWNEMVRNMISKTENMRNIILSRKLKDLLPYDQNIIIKRKNIDKYTINLMNRLLLDGYDVKKIPRGRGINNEEKNEILFLLMIKYNLLDLMMQQRIKYIVDFLYVAAYYGQLDCLKYLYENNCPWNIKGCTIAIKHGHLNCLKYLHENGVPWNKDFCHFAAGNGHLQCLKYLHENGCPWDQTSCEYAAKNGHLECLKYLHENRCPWDVKTFVNAVEYGQLKCMKYLYDNNCPWNDYCCLYASLRGHVDCLKYLYEKGCFWNKEKLIRVTKSAECLSFIACT